MEEFVYLVLYPIYVYFANTNLYAKIMVSKSGKDVLK